MVLNAVTIGSDARVGAGAIVVKDVPPGATVVTHWLLRDGRPVHPVGGEGGGTAGGLFAGSAHARSRTTAMTPPSLVVRELMAAGVRGAMVNLGGDVRVAGHAPEGEGWTVAVEDPFDASRELTRVHLSDGAVATSSRLVRRWNVGEADLHHLVDPQTGLPFVGDVAAVTVVAGSGWRAEAMAKAVFAVGADHAADVLVNATGIVVDRNGGRHATSDFSEVAA